MVEGWHGQPFDKPLARTREYVDIVRMALARETVNYDGEFYKLPLPNGTGLGKPLKLIIKPVQERIPIYLAAIGPKNTALAAEIADGWLPTLFAPEHLDAFRPSLEEGAARAGRSLDDLDITPQTSMAIYDDVEHARNFMRPYLALYIGGMGAREKNFYSKLVTRYGYGDAAKEIQDLYLAGKQAEAMAKIPDDLIDKVALTGPKERVKERLDGLPRRGRRDAARDTGGRHPGGPAADAAGPGRDCRLSPHGRLRIFIGAFGDAGHAFPAIALGTPARAARARGRARDLDPLAGARRGGGHALLPRARVPGVPDARASAEALRGRRQSRRARPHPRCATSRPTSR